MRDDLKTIYSSLAAEARPDRALVYSITRYNVFREANFVGGLADRLKGAICGFYLALISKRRFFIHWDAPLPLERNLSCNLLNWRYQEGRGQFRTTNYARILDLIDLGQDFDDTRPEDIEDRFFQDNEVIYFNANMLRAKTIQTLLREKYNCQTGREELIREGFKYLFNFEHKKTFEKSRNKVAELRANCSKMIGVHLRTGSGNGWRDADLDDWSSYEIVMKKALETAESIGCKSPGFYFVSDSAKAREAVHNATWPHPVIVELEQPSHLDRGDANEYLHDLAFHEFEMLSTMDQVVCGKGGFAYIAAVIGGAPIIRYFR